MFWEALNIYSGKHEGYGPPFKMPDLQKWMQKNSLQVSEPKCIKTTSLDGNTVLWKMDYKERKLTVQTKNYTEVYFIQMTGKFWEAFVSLCETAGRTLKFCDLHLQEWVKEFGVEIFPQEDEKVVPVLV